MTKQELIRNAKQGDKLLAVIKRLVFTEKSTISELWVNGIMFCHMLEDKDRGLTQWMTEQEIAAIKVPKATAIPRGLYHCKVTFSSRFQKMMPEVLNVPGFSGVRMHAGNKAEDTDGCPLFGDYNPSKQDWVSNSTARKDEFNMLINKVGGEYDLLVC